MECKTCKRAIVESIGLYFLQIGHCLLQQQQQLIICGCFADEFAWLITSGIPPEKVQQCYASNALEADNRIWRHVTQTTATKILICPPDTDVYNTGLSTPPDKDYRIAGNFRGVKFSDISDIQIISENILSEFIHAYNHGTS